MEALQNCGRVFVALCFYCQVMALGQDQGGINAA